MAEIVGGIATSHTPTIGFALDAGKQKDHVWAPIFKGYEPVRQWLADTAPDVLFYIFNDHMTSFFIDHYSHFTLGVGDVFPVADEGGGPRKLPALKGHPALAEHIAKGLVADEFDISTFQQKGLDHGCFSPLSLLLPHEKEWPLKVIRHYPEDIKVAIAGTGGLSHQVHGERCGFNNTPWDMEFMERLEKDPEGLLNYTHAELAELGGLEGAEIVMWMIMRGALAKEVKTTHKAYYLPSMCPIATMILEEVSTEKPEETDADYLKRIDRETAGLEKLDGTYPFTIGRGVKAFRLNDYLHSLIKPDERKLFLEDEEASFEKAGLTEKERDLVRRRDWRGLIHYGVIFFMLEKLGAAVGVSNLHIYAAMRGQSLEDFQKTRNAQVMYSVAGTDKGKTDWDKKPA